MSHELKGNLNNAINLNGSMQSSGNLRGQFQLGGGGGGTSDYNDLSNKPSINGHTLQGDSDTSDLELDYNDLLNLPAIPDMSGYYDKTEVDDLLEDKADKSQINYIWPAGEGNVVAQVDLIFDDETQEWVPTVTNINIPLYYSVTEMNALLEDKADTEDLSEVAFSGDYDDLINKPVIPGLPEYSTDEQIVGKWLNGENIYQRTIVKPNIARVTAATETVSEADLLLLGITASEIKDIEGLLITPTGGVLLSNTYLNNASIFNLWIANNAIYRWNQWSTAGGGDLYITVKYTKTI